MSIDQAALTGESLPVNKSVGEEIYSGSTCKQGEAEAIGAFGKRRVVRRIVVFSDRNGREHVFRSSCETRRHCARRNRTFANHFGENRQFLYRRDRNLSARRDSRHVVSRSVSFTRHCFTKFLLSALDFAILIVAASTICSFCSSAEFPSQCQRFYP